MTLHYTVSPARPDAHVFEVEMLIPGPVAAGDTLCMARWIPGSYMLRNFAKSIVRLQAFCGSRQVVLIKRDTSTWVLPESAQDVLIRLDVHAHEASVRAAWLDRQRGFFNGTSLFPYLPSRADEDVSVRINAPTHDEGTGWRLAATLEPVDVDAAGFGDYRAADWDELIDHPVEMGVLASVTFEAGGAAHEMVLAGGGRFDEQRLTEDLEVICDHHIRFFAAPAPVERYLFQTALMASGYGGLEHRASTALMATRESLPAPGAGARRSDDYVTFLGLCSHEYFHTWNVKRLKPACFEPFGLEAESPTRLLWFFEGITSYYDDLALVRCGMIDHERYLGLLARTLTRVQRTGGRHVQSVTDSSLDAWTKFYLQDENAPNAIVSYYAKGALIALCLDVWMRDATDERESLDTLMRGLYSRWLETGKGLAEDEPEQRVRELAGDEVADRLIATLDATGDLPLEAALQYFGVSLRWRSRTGKSDNGSCGGKDPDVVPPWSGATFTSADGGAKVVQVMNDGPAERAGLAPGDVLVALAGFRVSDGSLEELLMRHVGEDNVVAHYFRNGRLLETVLPISPPPADTAELTIADSTRVATWLGNAQAPG